MGRVVELNGYVVRVHTREDGDGPHVHVFKAGHEYRVRLLVGGAELMAGDRRRAGARSKARIALAIVRLNIRSLLEGMVQVPRTRPAKIDDEQWNLASLRGQLEMENGAADAAFDRKRDAFIVTMRSGAVAIMPRKLFPELERASVAELSDVEITPLRTSLLFNKLDDAISIFGMIREAFGINTQNRIAGMTTSEARAAASRRNGRQGGRPRA